MNEDEVICRRIFRRLWPWWLDVILVGAGLLWAIVMGTILLNATFVVPW